MISNLNELSEKFGYSLKTYNILGITLVIKGEFEKAIQIYENALKENNVYELQEGDPMLSQNNYELSSILLNYIKCNVIVNASSSMVQDSYQKAGL